MTELSANLLALEPIPALRARLEAEVAFDFGGPGVTRFSRAPGRLDVMGGIADYTGSMVCEATLDRAAAVALRTRADRQIQVFSFNLLDEHQPFTLRMDLDDLAAQSAASLRAEFDQPGRRWAAYLVGCLFVLHERGMIDLRDPGIGGMNIALLSTVPLGGGVSSSAAIEVATMMNLLDHFNLRAGGRLDAMAVAAMCQSVENRIVGAPCGIMDQVSSCAGSAGMLLRMVCQPHELQPPLRFPRGVRAVGINSNVRHSVGGGKYGRTRCAAFMGHRIILDKMRDLGAAAGLELHTDPMNGYLANLDPDDYKRLFRPYLPESIGGAAFLEKHHATIDTATAVEPNVQYLVQKAVDHHVLEARRVRRFAQSMEEAARAADVDDRLARGAALDRAGHLMYGSHHSYTNDAMLGADECDLLVSLARKREPMGIYGAKITGGGSGGTVAILIETDARADEAIKQIMAEYQAATGNKPEAFRGSSPGAWESGTVVVASE